MDQFNQIKSELNRLHGTSFDDNTSEAEVAAHLEKIQTMEGNTDTKTAEDYRKEVEELNTQFEGLDASLTEAKASNEALKGQVTELSEKVTGLETSLTEMTEKAEASQASLKTANDQIAELKTQVAELSGAAADDKNKTGRKVGGNMPDLSESERAFKNGVRQVGSESKY